jgi:hypothetical protein
VCLSQTGTKPDSLGKSGPGHGVGMPKKGVAKIYSLAVGVPFSNRGQIVRTNQDQSILELFYRQRSSALPNCQLPLGMKCSNRGQKKQFLLSTAGHFLFKPLTNRLGIFCQTWKLLLKHGLTPVCLEEINSPWAQPNGKKPSLDPFSQIQDMIRFFYSFLKSCQ